MLTRTPKDVTAAVRAFARAVKLVADMDERPPSHPLSEYHAKEYLQEMETLLLHQLLTAFPGNAERDEVLSDFGLDYLAGRMHIMAEVWEEE